jgi:hypothetical protein
VEAEVVEVVHQVHLVVRLVVAVVAVSLWVGQEFQHLHLALLVLVEQAVLDKQAVLLVE